MGDVNEQHQTTEHTIIHAKSFQINTTETYGVSADTTLDLSGQDDVTITSPLISLDSDCNVTIDSAFTVDATASDGDFSVTCGEIYMRAGSGFPVEVSSWGAGGLFVSGAGVSRIASDGDVVTIDSSDLDAAFNQLLWREAQAPSITQTTRTTDAAPNNLLIQAQSAWASASTNETGGSIRLMPGEGGGTGFGSGGSGGVQIYCGTTASGVDGSTGGPGLTFYADDAFTLLGGKISATSSAGTETLFIAANEHLTVSASNVTIGAGGTFAISNGGALTLGSTGQTTTLNGSTVTVVGNVVTSAGAGKTTAIGNSTGTLALAASTMTSTVTTFTVAATTSNYQGTTTNLGTTSGNAVNIGNTTGVVSMTGSSVNLTSAGAMELGITSQTGLTIGRSAANTAINSGTLTVTSTTNSVIGNTTIAATAGNTFAAGNSTGTCALTGSSITANGQRVDVAYTALSSGTSAAVLDTINVLTSAVTTLNLPTVTSGDAGKAVVVVSEGTAVTVNRGGANTINAGNGHTTDTSYSMTTAKSRATFIVSSGGNWIAFPAFSA